MQDQSRDLAKQVFPAEVSVFKLTKRVEIVKERCAPTASGRLADNVEILFENFELTCNLMLAVTAHIVKGG